MNTLQAVRFYMLCVYLIVWTRPKLKVYFACQFWSAPRTRARTHTRAHTHTHTLQPGEQRFSCGLYFQRFIIKHVQQFSNCKDGILQQSTDDWSDSDVKFWSGRNECAPLWREWSCARRNAAIFLRSKKKTLNKLILKFNIRATGLKCKHVLMVSSLF